jgi:hypothetical protein
MTMPDPAAFFSRFEDYALLDARLTITQEHKKLIAKHKYKYKTSLSDEDFPDIKTAFFSFAELEDAHIDSLDQYVFLGKEDLGERLDDGTLVPFAALNQSGSNLGYGLDIFAETNSWGVLCFDLASAEGDDCPVVWALHGKLYPWVTRASSLEVESLEPEE